MKLSGAQLAILRDWPLGEVKSAYDADASLSSLRALCKRGLLKDVTPPGPGGIFSPRTHFKFERCDTEEK